MNLLDVFPRTTGFDHANLPRRYSVAVSEGLHGQRFLCADCTHIGFRDLGTMRRFDFHDDFSTTADCPWLTTVSNAPPFPDFGDRTTRKLPDIASDDLVDRLVGNLVLFGQFHDRQARLVDVTFPNLSHDGGVEFRSPCSTAPNHVYAVCFLTAFVKMVWATARRVVTFMQNVIFGSKITVGEFVGDAACYFPAVRHAAGALDFDQSTTVVPESLLADPRPATRSRAINFRPEALSIDRASPEILYERHTAALHRSLVYLNTPMKSRPLELGELVKGGDAT